MSQDRKARICTRCYGAGTVRTSNLSGKFVLKTCNRCKGEKVVYDPVIPKQTKRKKK